ncbi:MAG: hypothetical protein ACM3UP_00580 [Methanocella sp.]
MALDGTVKIGPEFFLFISTDADAVAVDSATEVPTEKTAPAPTWSLIGFSRLPLEFSEPQALTDVYKNFEIDHTKRGKAQRKTLKIKKAFTNMGESLLKYRKQKFFLKVEVRPDNGAANELWYFTDVQILTPTISIPDEEGLESADCTYALFGHKDATA